MCSFPFVFFASGNILNFFKTYSVCINVLPECVSVHHVRVWCPRRTEEEEGIESCGTGFIGGCEPPCWFWNSNLSPLQEQALLTAEPSFCSRNTYVKADPSWMFSGLKFTRTGYLIKQIS